MVETLRAWQGTLGWRATASSWNILGSHDSARIRTVVGGDAAVHRVAAGLQFTLPGVPMLFAGDEIGLEGVNGEDSRRTMPWHRPDGSVLVVARRAAAPGFSLPLDPGRHVLGSEPGGADLTSSPDGVEVPATDGPRVDIWALDQD